LSDHCLEESRIPNRRSHRVRRYANEHAPRFAWGTIRAQIGCEGLPDIDRQGHPIVQQPLTSNEQLAGSPVNVIELEGHNLSGTEAEAGQQEKDGVIAAAGGGLTIAGAEHLFNLIWAQVLGYGGQAPIGNGGHRKSQINLQLPVLKKEAKEGAESGRNQLCPSGAHGRCIPQNKIRNI
jgi:hypothetical protein